jgi:hypothetical protein
MDVKTIIPDSKGMIYLLCPFCSVNSLESVTSYPVHEVIRKDCSCGKSWKFIIEHRKAYRKRTALTAVYWDKSAPNISRNGTILDLTLDGCRLLVSDGHSLQKGNHINLYFKLDNAARTKIEREAQVRRVDKNSIGCKFIGKAVYEPELGFYVQDFMIPK